MDKKLNFRNVFESADLRKNGTYSLRISARGGGRKSNDILNYDLTAHNS